jgi:hypothetical protein
VPAVCTVLVTEEDDTLRGAIAMVLESEAAQITPLPRATLIPVRFVPMLLLLAALQAALWYALSGLFRLEKRGRIILGLLAARSRGLLRHVSHRFPQWSPAQRAEGEPSRVVAVAEIGDDPMSSILGLTSRSCGLALVDTVHDAFLFEGGLKTLPSDLVEPPWIRVGAESIRSW